MLRGLCRRFGRHRPNRVPWLEKDKQSPLPENDEILKFEDDIPTFAMPVHPGHTRDDPAAQAQGQDPLARTRAPDLDAERRGELRHHQPAACGSRTSTSI